MLCLVVQLTELVCRMSKLATHYVDNCQVSKTHSGHMRVYLAACKAVGW